MLKTEYSGLRSSSFRAIGKYGIGFYSIFMVASSAEVMTRVYNKGTDTSILLKFPYGLTLTPIKQNVDSRSTIISTKITLKLNPEIYKWDGKYTIRRNVAHEPAIETSFENVLKALCAGLDVDVVYHENAQPERRLHQDITAADLDKKQWLRDISFADDQANPDLDKYIESNYKRLEYIYKEGYVCGLAAINIRPTFRQDFLSISTIGGLASQIHMRDSEHFIGYMDSIPSTANRNGVPPMLVYGEEIKQWALRQFEQVKPTLTEEQRLFVPYGISMFQVDTSDVCLIQVFTNKLQYWRLSIEDFLRKIERENARIVLSLSGYIRGKSRHVDTYTQYQDILPHLKNGDYWISPIHNSSFLNVSEDKKYTLYSYIYETAKRMNIELEEKIIEDAFRTALGPGDLLYLTVKKH